MVITIPRIMERFSGATDEQQGLPRIRTNKAECAHFFNVLNRNIARLEEVAWSARSWVATFVHLFSQANGGRMSLRARVSSASRGTQGIFPGFLSGDENLL